jgi:hypothetical protein
MHHCPSHDWDSYCNQQDHQMVETWKLRCKPKDGLYSKFIVHKAIYTEHELPSEAGGGIEMSVDQEPAEGGSFVLVPFRADGTVRDPAAIAALQAYCGACGIPGLQAEIGEWLDAPAKFEWLNQPCEI